MHVNKRATADGTNFMDLWFKKQTKNLDNAKLDIKYSELGAFPALVLC